MFRDLRFFLFISYRDLGRGFNRFGNRRRSHSLRAFAVNFVFLVVVKSFSGAERIFDYAFLVQRCHCCI